MTPVSPARIIALLEEEQIAAFVEDDAVRVGFTNTWITFELTDAHLIANATWNATVDAARGAELLAAVNEWNQTTITPAMRFYEGEPGRLVVGATRRVATSPPGGLTDEQLGTFLVSTLSAFGDCFSFLEEQFPDLIEWED